MEFCSKIKVSTCSVDDMMTLLLGDIITSCLGSIWRQDFPNQHIWGAPKLGGSPNWELAFLLGSLLV